MKPNSYMAIYIYSISCIIYCIVTHIHYLQYKLSARALAKSTTLIHKVCSRIVAILTHRHRTAESDGLSCRLPSATIHQKFYVPVLQLPWSHTTFSASKDPPHKASVAPIARLRTLRTHLSMLTVGTMTPFPTLERWQLSSSLSRSAEQLRVELVEHRLPMCGRQAALVLRLHLATKLLRRLCKPPRRAPSPVEGLHVP